MGVEDAFREGRQNTDGMKRKEKIENNGARRINFMLSISLFIEFSHGHPNICSSMANL